MNTIIVKLAANHDREALCRLYHEFHEFHVHGVPDRLLSLGEPLDTYEHSDLYQALAKIVEGADSVIFVAEAAHQLIGLAEVYVRQDEPNPLKTSYRHGHLQSLIVKEAFRGQGIGAKLLEAAQQWAKEKGATEMRVETWEFEEGPLRFYEKNDYRTLRRTLVRAL
jgi:GNAT superfamily N-acetyltransferase